MNGNKSSTFGLYRWIKTSWVKATSDKGPITITEGLIRILNKAKLQFMQSCESKPNSSCGKALSVNQCCLMDHGGGVFLPPWMDKPEWCKYDTMTLHMTQSAAAAPGGGGGGVITTITIFPVVYLMVYLMKLTYKDLGGTKTRFHLPLFPCDTYCRLEK